MTDPVTYQRKDVLGTEVDGDLVLLDETAGQYYAIGSVGAAIWAMLETPMTLDALCAKLSETYEVDPEACMSDTKEFLQDMKSKGMII